MGKESCTEGGPRPGSYKRDSKAERTGLGGRLSVGPPQFWLGGELFMRWGLPEGQLFAFLEPEA